VTTGTYQLTVDLSSSVCDPDLAPTCVPDQSHASIGLDLVVGTVAPPLSIDDVSLAEGTGGAPTPFTFTVSLLAPATAPITVHYATAPGTAGAGTDYETTSGQVAFAVGDQTKTVTVWIVADSDDEDDETFTVELSSPTGATIGDGTGDGTIGDDDDAPSLTVDFDWSMPDRYGFDRNGDGVTDSYRPDGNLVTKPNGWRVDLAQTDPASCDSAISRTWNVDGQQILATDPAVISYDPHACTLAYRFPKEGVFRVELVLRNAGGVQVGSHARDVTVQDWLIVSVGDSVASGEGVPDKTSLNPFAAETWQDQQCHRSALSGPAQAAMALERADPHTSVTFIHLACSGATIDTGLIGPYAGIESFSRLPPQLDQIRTFVFGREIDAVTVSIGANDVQFANILTSCLVRPTCYQDAPGSAARLFATLAARLPARYAALQAGLASRSIDPGRVFITQYFDPTRTDLGAICPNGTILGDAPSLGGVLQISQAEADWASNQMLVRLDTEVRAAASTHGWHFVDGIRNAFLTHGYCAALAWVIRFTESFANQGDRNGTIHPNVPGHALYGRQIADSLTQALYTGGDITKPRPPAP